MAIASCAETILSVSLGNYHSSVITSEGRIFTWGSNTNGRLGDGTTVNKSTPTEITSFFYLTPGEKVIKSSLGLQYSSALTSRGRIFTWGFNSSGQLGDGTNVYRDLPVQVLISNIETLNLLFEIEEETEKNKN